MSNIRKKRLNYTYSSIRPSLHHAICTLPFLRNKELNSTQLPTPDPPLNLHIFESIWEPIFSLFARRQGGLCIGIASIVLSPREYTSDLRTTVVKDLWFTLGQSRVLELSWYSRLSTDVRLYTCILIVSRLGQ